MEKFCYFHYHCMNTVHKFHNLLLTVTWTQILQDSKVSHFDLNTMIESKTCSIPVFYFDQ